MDALSSLRLILFGTPEILVEDTPIEVDTRKAIALLAYLAVKKQPISRDVLCNVLWTDYDQQSASASLRRTLSVAYKALQRKWLAIERTRAGLSQAPDVWVDVNRFRELVQMAHHHQHPSGICATCYARLCEAVELYRDDFLAGFNLRDGSNFEEWQSFESESLRHDLNFVYAGIIEWHIHQQDFEVAIAFAKRWVQMDGFYEKAQHMLIQLYAQAGQRPLALQTYETYRLKLEQELDIAPLPETTDLYERILEGHFQVLEHPMSKMQSFPITHNLPAIGRPFIGRTEQLTALTTLLQDPTCRLLTIVGPGGMGKTRLALKVAEKQLDRFAHGVFFVEIQPPVTAESIIGQIASTIQHTFLRDTAPERSLKDYLQDKHMLLILDGFEIALEQVAVLVNLLHAAPAVKMLVTSQVPLDSTEEWQFPLHGLEVEETVDFFAAYSKRVLANQTFDTQLVTPLHEILGGVPLAVELAIGWLNVLSFEELQAEILQNQGVLQATRQDMPARHANLNAIFSYLWSLLTPELMTTLQKLTIFEGGFERQAAQTVTKISLPALSALLQRALLVNQGGRYRMLNPLRAFILVTYTPEPDIQRRHSLYYGDWMQRQVIHGRDQKKILQAIAIELPNILTGWQWAIQHYVLDTVIHYSRNLFSFFEVQGRFEEALPHFEKAVQAFQRSNLYYHSEAYGLLLANQGSLLAHQGNFGVAHQLFKESHAIFTGGNHWREVGQVLNYLGLIAMMRGQHTEANAYFDESLAIYQELADELGTAKVLNNIGILLNRQAKYQEAIPHLGQALQIYRQIGDERLLAYTQNNMANALVGLGKLEEAIPFYQESYEHKLNLGDEWGVACALTNLGDIAHQKDRNHQAQELFQACLQICRRIGKKDGMVTSLKNLAMIARHEQEPETANGYLREALYLAAQVEIPSLLLEVLLELAALHVKEHRDQAIRLLQLVASDKRTRVNIRSAAVELLKDMGLEPTKTADTLEKVLEELDPLNLPSDPILVYLVM